MEKIKVYQYSKCSTCRKALKYLNALDIPYDAVPIVETPPSKSELKVALDRLDGNFKKMFNTSGMVYREMKLSQKIKTMQADEAIELLAANGKLVKRPFVLTETDVLVGFKEEIWDAVFKDK